MLFLLSLPSCRFKGDAFSNIISLIPGECLESEKFLPYVDNPVVHVSESKNSINIKLFLDVETRFVQRDSRLYEKSPSDNVFNSFEENSVVVRNEYETVLEEFEDQLSRPYFEYNTIYYCGGLKLTASKKVAGIDAYEDLSSLVTIKGWEFELNPPYLEIPSDYIPLSSSLLNLYITAPDDYKIVYCDRKAYYELELPVKVGMYLNYLIDRLENPSATMQYKDVVLKGSFYLDYNFE